MSRREKGTYGVLDKTVLAYAKRHRDASVSVLIALAERSNYTRTPTLRVAELMLETDLKERAVEKCLTRLMAAGLCVRAADGWAYQQPNHKANGEANDSANGDANRDANDDANGEAYSGTPSEFENAVQDEELQAVKEVEGLRRKEKEEEGKEKEPPTPQGGAQNGTAFIDSSSQGSGENSEPPERQSANATDNQIVPAARRAADALPADLAALPGFAEAWASWLAYRREAKLEMRPYVLTAQLASLRALPAVIEQSRLRGWANLFAVKSDAPQRQNMKFTPRPQTTEQANQQAADRAAEIFAALQEDTRAVF